MGGPAPPLGTGPFIPA